MALIPTSQQAAILQVTQAMLGAAPGAQLMNTYLTSTTTVASFASQVAATDLWKTTMGYGSLSDLQTYQKFLGTLVGNTVDATLQSNMAAYLASVTGTGKTYATNIAGISALISALADPANITNADWGTAATMFQNKVAVGSYYTLDRTGNTSSLAELQQVAAGVTADPASVTYAMQQLEAVQLTAYADVKSGSLFVANQVYTPGGNDFINSLQDVDRLTGTGTDNKLVAYLGDNNDAAGAVVSPTLNNIQTIDFANIGATNTIDLRYADSALKNLNITRFSQDAAGIVNFNQIPTANANNLSVANNATVVDAANFNYRAGMLAAVDSATLTVKNMFNNATGGGVFITDGAAGFETLALVSEGVNRIATISDLSLIDMTITAAATGSTELSVFDGTQQTDRVFYAAGGITDGGAGLGIKTINGGTFAGNLNLDVTAALGGHADPANSGSKYYATITTGTGNDTIISRVALGLESATLRDVIAAGDGTDTLRMVSGNINKVGTALNSITGVETLEMLDQTAGASAMVAYVSAFDGALTTVNMRNESVTRGAAQVNDAFTLREVGATLASSGNINFFHASGGIVGAASNPTAAIDTYNVRLNDATGAADTVALTGKTANNVTTTYDYSIGLEVEKDSAGAYKGWVENLTINDNDNESNTVKAITGNDSKGNLTALGLTGTITLTGGTAGLNYKVDPTLFARTVDAATQASNLTLKVGNPTDSNNYGTTVLSQTINLGSGNDMLTFDGGDFLSGIDTITDAGGTDTVRAWYSKDGGTPTLTGAEKFHLMATANSTIDLSKATGITELALLSENAVEIAVHGTQGRTTIFTAAPTGVVADTDTLTAATVTLQNTNMSTLNYFADTINNTSTVQFFNAVTLSNNAATSLTVNVNNSLEGDATKNEVTNYTLGKLTAHGVEDMTIAFTNEVTNGAVNTILDIWDQNLKTLKVTAIGNVNLGDVTGNAAMNSITSVDATGITKGNFTASVHSLGSGAIVNLTSAASTVGAANDIFSAIDSNGNNIVINGLGGNDTITGSDQTDIITTLGGNDTIHGLRGDNTISAGAGNDTITASEGNNTINTGTGINTVALNVNTGLLATTAKNSISANGAVNTITISTAGGTALAAGDVLFDSVVGAGTQDGRLTLGFTGNQLTTALLEGTKAVTAGTANSDLMIAHDVAAGTNVWALNANVANMGTAGAAFNGGAGDDVMYNLSSVATTSTFVGGAGNDAIFAGEGSNIVTGGTGADIISLGGMDVTGGGIELVISRDTVVIADGDSVASGYDQILRFDVAGGGAAAVADELDLASAVIAGAGSFASANGLYVYTIGAAGVLTIADTAAAAQTITTATSTATNKISLTAVLTELASNAAGINGTTATVIFEYDRENDGATDDSFVFQDGASDTVVQLIGLTGVGLAAGADGANVGIV